MPVVTLYPLRFDPIYQYRLDLPPEISTSRNWSSLVI